MSKRRAPGGERRFTVIPGEGKPDHHGRKAAVYYIILALVLILVLQAGYHWVSAQVLAQRLQIVAAEPGHLDRTIPMEGFVVRDEQVVPAPCSGVVLEMYPAGERITAGISLVKLAVMTPEEIASFSETPEVDKGWWEKLQDFAAGWLQIEKEEEKEEDLTVFKGEIPPWHTARETVAGPSAGLLSYHLDGWENYNGATMLALGRDGTLPEASCLVEGAVVEAGQPLFKIVDNWYWYYYVSLPLEAGRTAAAQETVYISFDFAPDLPVAAKLQESVIDAAAGEVRLSYRLEQQLPGFETVRRVAAEVSFQRQSGLLIPATALLEREGETGVYLNTSGTVTYAPVTVLRQQEGKALVDGIEPFVLVIGNPELVREGQRLH